MCRWIMLVPGVCLTAACFVRGLESNVTNVSQTFGALTSRAAPLVIVWLTDLGSVRGLLLRSVLYLGEVIDR